YRGSFEAGGQPLGPVVARVRKALRPLTRTLGAPLQNGLVYVAFGRPEACYFIHPITQAPDFDQILRGDLAQSGLTADQLRRGVPLTFPGRDNRVEDRLQPGSFEATLPDRRHFVLSVEAVLSTLVGPMFTDGPDQ